ncbi:hypothetical protein [Xanthomonas phage DES1]|nr:hypothetical protein [Xanthomonas phage DES1]
MDLTQLELIYEDIDVDIEQVALDLSKISDTDVLGSAQKGTEEWKRLDSLPKAVVRQMEREEARKARKKLIIEERRAGKRKKPGVRGHRHWKKKEATKKRQRAKKWQEEPLTCILHMNVYTAKKIDKELWERHAMPLWRENDASMLSVKFPYTAGTRAKPWSMFNIKIIHKEKGILLDGESLELYILSGGQ